MYFFPGHSLSSNYASFVFLISSVKRELRLYNDLRKLTNKRDFFIPFFHSHFCTHKQDGPFPPEHGVQPFVI